MIKRVTSQVAKLRPPWLSSIHLERLRSFSRSNKGEAASRRTMAFSKHPILVALSLFDNFPNDFEVLQCLPFYNNFVIFLVERAEDHSIGISLILL